METRAPYDDIDFSPPKGCMEEAQRGLDWHEEGLSGDGLVPATVRWARRIANGGDITPDKARKMRAWLARHEVDKEAEGFRPGEKGYPTPGRVAWALWCGDAGVAWSNRLVRQMEAADAAKSWNLTEGGTLAKQDKVIRRINIDDNIQHKANRYHDEDHDKDDEEMTLEEWDSMAMGDEEEDKGLTVVVASAPTPDRYNDIVEPSWNLKRFMANPVVPFAHDYTRPPVGRVRNLEVVNGLLMASIEWDDSPSNPLGQTVASQFRRGFMNAVSVGFAPGEVVPRATLPEDSPYRADTGNLYRQPELLEISAVPIPAHQDALAIRSHQGAELKHIVAMEETDNTYVVTYAKAQMQEPAEEEPEQTEERSMREVFGTHPLQSFFGQ